MFLIFSNTDVYMGSSFKQFLILKPHQANAARKFLLDLAELMNDTLAVCGFIERLANKFSRKSNTGRRQYYKNFPVAQGSRLFLFIIFVTSFLKFWTFEFLFECFNTEVDERKGFKRLLLKKKLQTSKVYKHFWGQYRQIMIRLKCVFSFFF